LSKVTFSIQSKKEEEKKSDTLAVSLFYRLLGSPKRNAPQSHRCNHPDIAQNYQLDPDVFHKIPQGSKKR
jgi:hypothetical protein